MDDSRLKLLFTALIGAGTALWGWLGWLVIVWVLVMILDYVTGSLSAIKRHEWSSQRAREGLWHKAGMIVAVAVAGFADCVLSTLLRHVPVQLPFNISSLCAPIVMAWYILTELGSMLENAVAMGAKVPSWLKDALAKTAQTIENGDGQLPK